MINFNTELPFSHKIPKADAEVDLDFNIDPSCKNTL